MAPMKRPPPEGEAALPPTLSVMQLARRWQTKPKEIKRLLGQQILPFVQVRGAFRVARDDVQRYEATHGRPV
jgi:hypothetical protein